MKKQLMILALALSTSAVFAQDLTSRKGEPFLPEAGDWAISFDASPFLSYAGNLFNNSTNNTLNLNSSNGFPVSIVGKYFVDEKTAYRGLLRIGFSSQKFTGYVKDGSQGADPDAMVTDTRKVGSSNIVLGAGIEKRRGKTRLQGYYGGMLYISTSSLKNQYTYGNEINQNNTNPPSTDFGTTNILPNGERVTVNKTGSNFGFGLVGFVGFEYFIFPKISVGAEYRWGLGYESTSDGSRTTEKWDAAKTVNNIQTKKTGGTSEFFIDGSINGSRFKTAPIGASLNINFHF